MCRRCDEIERAVGAEAFARYAEVRDLSAVVMSGSIDALTDALGKQQFRDALVPALAIAMQCSDLALMSEDASHKPSNIDRYAKAFDLLRDVLATMQADYTVGLADARDKGLLP